MSLLRFPIALLNEFNETMMEAHGPFFNIKEDFVLPIRTVGAGTITNNVLIVAPTSVVHLRLSTCAQEVHLYMCTRSALSVNFLKRYLFSGFTYIYAHLYIGTKGLVLGLSR